MKITAEQMLKGIVVDLREGPENTDVYIKFPSGQIMAAVLTHASVKNLGLSIGKPLMRNTTMAVAVPQKVY